jgi:hypothetical protein
VFYRICFCGAKIRIFPQLVGIVAYKIGVGDGIWVMQYEMKPKQILKKTEKAFNMPIFDGCVQENE